MKKNLSGSVLGLVFGLTSVLIPLQAMAAGSSATFATEVKKILAGSGAKVSFSLRDADGLELASVNSETPMAPASVAKTISTGCSLIELGPQHQFDTLFGFTGKVTGDTLDGDLVIQGSGDPSLVVEDLHDIIEKLRVLHGIKKINGKLLIDASYLGKKSLSMADGFEGDEGRSFTAELTPVIMNQNSFSFWVTPDVRDNSSTRVVTLPANVMEVKVTNKTKVAGSTELNVSYSPENLQATVHGNIARDGEPKGLYRATDDAYDYSVKLMHRLWIDSGGEWKDQALKVSTTPVKFTLLWKHQSPPLSKILTDVNKFSLNLGAEMIFLAAGAEKYGTPASYEKSLKMLGECLTAQKVKPGSFVLTNGSGLSREATVKTSALSQFLGQYLSTDFAPEYLSTFGLLGIDGTSKSRLKNYAGRARLKTGSLKDVRAIAGFLYSKEHKVYTFAMIQNGVNPNNAKSLEDKVIETFLKEF